MLGGSEFQTFTTRSVKEKRRVLHRECNLYSLYLWPRVLVTALNVKKSSKLISRHEDVSVRDLVILNAPIGGHRCTILLLVSFIYKNSQMSFPFFSVNANIHSHYTKHVNDYHLTTHRTRLLNHTIRIAGPQLSNLIDINIRLLKKYLQF